MIVGTLCSWQKWRIAAALCAVIGLSAMGARAEPAPGPEPLASLDDRGASLPPVGRSIFDFMVAKQVDGEWIYDVPFPFEALMDHLKAGLDEGYRGPTKEVLHPIGRSLHRHAASPHDYFRYPRAVIAVDAESVPPAGRSGAMLRDRLYIGYQPLSESVELIAYNEAAGRFEYQVVIDYREGGTPKVTYADRGLCTACHHNQSVIYAGAPWAESNSSAQVVALLREEAESFYGIPAQVSFDIPELFDEATDRTNFFSAYQLAWQDGCEATGDFESAVACRRDGLISALRYRLTSGYQLTDSGDGTRDRFADAIVESWLARWPRGVEIASADLLDLDPFGQPGYAIGSVGADIGVAELAAMVNDDMVQFEAEYEPLFERAPKDVWMVAAPFAGLSPVEPSWVSQVIGGLGNFLAAVDIERLSDHLAASSAPERGLSFPCQVVPGDAAGETINIWFQCDASLGERAPLKGQLRGGANGAVEGVLSRLHPETAAPAGMVVRDGRFERTESGWRARFALRDSVTGFDARMGDGNYLRDLVLDWPAVDGVAEAPVAATITMTIADDFAIVVAAIDDLAEATLAGESDALAYAPFRRVAVLRPIFDQIGFEPMDWCCLDADHLPPPVHHDDVE